MNPGHVMMTGALLINAAAILLAGVAVAGLEDVLDLVVVLFGLMCGLFGIVYLATALNPTTTSAFTTRFFGGAEPPSQSPSGTSES